MPPRRNAERHEQVLDAAIELIGKKGLDGTSLQDIADNVGIRKASVVHYFASSAQLGELIQARFTKIATDELTKIVTEVGRSSEDRLRDLLCFHAEHCTMRLSSPVLISYIQNWGSPSSPEGARQLTIRDAYEEPFRRMVAECVDQGVFREVNIELVVRGMVGMMSWTRFWFDRNVHGDLRTAVRPLIDMCFNGLRPSPS